MDLNSRVDSMDEELKLLKNEIKQVLLEVQEHVLNVQNPFSSVGGSSGFVNVSPTPDREPVPAAASAGGGDQAPPIPQAPIMPQAAPMPQAPIIINPTPVADTGQAAAPIAPPIAPVGGMNFPQPNQGGSNDFVDAGGPGLGPPGESDGASLGSGPLSSFGPADDSLSPTFVEDDSPGLPADDDDGGPSTPPPGMEDDDDEGPSAGPPPARDGKTRDARRKSAKPLARDEPDDDELVEEDLGSERERDTERDEVDDYEDEAYDEDDEPPRIAPQQDTDARKRKSAAVAKIKESGMDLVTLAGLAQWMDYALRRVGQEHVGTLLEVSALTGRISDESKDILLAMVPLFADRDTENPITAKSLVGILGQLDALMGQADSNEIKLLSFLLQDDSEVFPLIRP